MVAGPYAAFNNSDDCISVVDIDPASKTYNQEIEVLPTTGIVLAGVGSQPRWETVVCGEQHHP